MSSWKHVKLLAAGGGFWDICLCQTQDRLLGLPFICPRSEGSNKETARVQREVKISTISTFHFPPSAPSTFHHQHLPGLEEGRSGTQSLPWLASTVRWSIVLCRQRVFKLSKVQSFFSSAGKHHCLHWGAVAFARTQWLHPSLLLVSMLLNSKPCNEPKDKWCHLGTTPGIMTHPWMSHTGSGLTQRILF